MDTAEVETLAEVIDLEAERQRRRNMAASVAAASRVLLDVINDGIEAARKIHPSGRRW